MIHSCYVVKRVNRLMSKAACDAQHMSLVCFANAFVKGCSLTSCAKQISAVIGPSSLDLHTGMHFHLTWQFSVTAAVLMHTADSCNAPELGDK